MSSQNTTNILENTRKRVDLELSMLTTHQLKDGDEQILASIMNRLLVEPLELGKQQATIDPLDSNKVNVFWPCTGDGNMLGIPDATGYCPSYLKGQRRVTKVYTTVEPVTDSESAKVKLQTDIQFDTADIRAYIDRINAEIAPHNAFINSTVPKLVNERIKELRRVKDVQDFLSA
jgi:hypothetical protein